ncbi:putative membrane protein [Mumia flava]|uniref:Putative membrane protein n=1 Tax=Mumia flava TaxID=1348852 RepID=A0A2M9BIM1_9ACTN|nr:DUF2254 domain-containing protein [Mumia flava]PJJ57754.1 putative membrane protein [Mumia flava]
MDGFWSGLRDRFWVLPMLCAAVAVVVAVLLSELDETLGTADALPFLFSGGPEGARVLLSAIITSMISFTGLVFSITIVVLQLTSSQFSPRVLRTFLQDRLNQLTLGVFIATFVYALVVLRDVSGTNEQNPFVPQVALTVAFGLVLASVVVFLIYIHHITQSIRVATIIRTVGNETRRVLERRYPSDVVPAPRVALPEGPGRVVASGTLGVVQRIDDDDLAHLAAQQGVTICLLRAVGEFVPARAPLAEIHGGDRLDDETVRSAIGVGSERNFDQDVGFGFRQLTDIAERAISPGINDPTTAVQAVDQMHDLLRRLATRPLPPRQVVREGRLLVDVPQPGLGDYLALAVDEIARWGADDERVLRRLRVMLADLEHAALPVHRSAVLEVLGRLDTVGDQRTVAGRVDALAPSDVGVR